MSDEVGLRIRVDEMLRRDFLEACKSQDTTGSQVLRAFMRSYVDRFGVAYRQPELFTGLKSAGNG